MFKKKPQIKNLSPLRSSDRRKLADQIIQDYQIRLPQTPQEAIPENTTDSRMTESTLQPTETLSSLRGSLLPESSLSARFTTTTGPNSSPVSGTVYVGAHPGQPERILWLQFGQDKRLYPTVYTLWQNPAIIPLLHTQDFVVEKLKGGADMMVPGLVGGPPWPEKATTGSVVAIASANPAKDTVPVWIGRCEIDISALGDVKGSKGRAIKGLQWVGDELWSWSSIPGISGSSEPDKIEGWTGLNHITDGRLDSRIEEDTAQLHLDDDEQDDEVQEDGGVTLTTSRPDLSNGQMLSSEETKANEQGDVEPEREPKTTEVDAAFHSAFVYSLYNAKQRNQPPNYGFGFPIQPSYLISNMIQPFLQFQNQHFTIKKTSWKNTKKFIKYLDKQALVKSKDRNGGETVILDIDFDDVQVQNFTPYKLPKPKATASGGDGSSDTATGPGMDTSIGQTLNLITLFRPSGRLVPDLFPSKSSFYTPTHVSNFLKTYVSTNTELTTGTSHPRNVKINPFISNNVLGSNTTAADTKHLAAGEIPRDVLLKRIQEDHHLCTPYWTLSTDPDQKWDPDSANSQFPKPKPFPLPVVHLHVEKRTGSKLVTKITNLEAFLISPAVLAPELQRKCAGSASVGQAMGAKPGMMEILVQGDQRATVLQELERRGVRSSWVDVVDKTNKAKGAAGGGVTRR